ncbi:TetR family transcriptional regulator [Longimycelium tulufanense]|uniref:TetR family transcriptional regulator n=1 Tax=Longimycelium tulufanense TaxID=907463 RepID=A0A8J3CBP2_9PSEU|nr:TetR/AcrR family transcriptional regulator [Longimycelium tulufanense]GGM43958.1 TetR family transcriptional regulator [Longimycelium tulufanense]
MAEGLRERKKQRTRQHISDVATQLFIERGFDQVTVAEIAAAAEVSKMTVFNYFPRKEDLYLDRYQETRDLLLGAVRGRPAGRSVVEAARDLLIDLVRRRHPLGGILEGLPTFWEVVKESPALGDRLRQQGQELAEELAGALAEEAGVPAHDPTMRTVAGTIVTTIGVIYREALRRLFDGEPVDKVHADQPRLIEEQFALLSAGLADFGRPTRSTTSTSSPGQRTGSTKARRSSAKTRHAK